MISPCMVTTDVSSSRSGWIQSPSKVRHRKQRHFVLPGHARLTRCLEKRIDCLAHLRKQTSLATYLLRVCVEPAELSKEDLSLHVNAGNSIGAGFDQQRHLF